MTAPRAALEARFPGAQILDDAAGLYARAEMETEQVSVAVGRDSIVALRSRRQESGGRVLLTFAGMAEGRTVEEALDGLLHGLPVMSAPVARAA